MQTKVLYEKIPRLYDAIDVFIASKQKVLQQWMQYGPPGDVLARHNIDIETFLTEYAGRIFDYYIAVVRGEMKIGDCPVMMELLRYFKDHDLSADELFIICNHFRKSMLDVSYDMQMGSKEMFDEINYVFDLNFTGVLKLYSERVYEVEQELAKNIKLISEYKKAIDESAIVSKTDINGIITYVNDNFINACGFSRDELIGSSYGLIRHSDMPSKFYQKLWGTIQNGAVFHGTVKNRRKGGGYFYIDTTILPIVDQDMRVTEYMAISYEVTKLIDAKQEAVDAGEAKDYFLSNMSHEIRTPLNAILGFVLLLLEEDNSPKHQKYLDIIHKSGESLLSIINDILDFSKLRSGEFTVDKKVFNLHEELPLAIELFASDANEKAITLFSYIDPAIPHALVADPLRIKQIISNFLSNAIKFTPQRGRIDVEAKYEFGLLKIKVTDNGIGISMDDQKRIFNAFVQSRDGVERFCGGGTGLGLSICQQLAEHMHGSVRLESRLGKGSSFELVLPVEASSPASLTLFDPAPFKKLRLGLLQCCDKESDKLASLKRHWEAFDLNIVTVDRIEEDGYDLLFFVDNDIDEPMRRQIMAQSLPSIAIMDYLDDRYDSVENITPLYFPIYCTKLYQTFSEALNLVPKTKSKPEEGPHRRRKFNAHILVAEDNAANQELIKIILERYGITYEVVADGIDVLNRFESADDFDMILMDEQMPTMNGIEAMEHILDLEERLNFEHTPIVALTANVIKGAREHGLSVGYDAFLGKPIIIRDLERVFEQFLIEEEVEEASSVENIEQLHEEHATGIRGIDVKKLQKELMLEPDQLEMLLRIFLKKMATVMPDLHAAVEAGKYEEIARLAHMVKGSCANFRIKKMYTLTTEIESAASEKKDADYRHLFQTLQKEFDKITIEE